MGRRGPTPYAPGSVGVPLLGPGIAPHVVAVALPESGAVLIDELNPSEPLCTLPEIEVRHDEPHRPPVIGLEVLAIRAMGDEDVRTQQIRKRKIGRVVMLAV